MMHLYKYGCLIWVGLLGYVHTCLAQWDPGDVVFDSTSYVEYEVGNLPIILSVPHGGYASPENVPDRDCDRYTCVRDAYTQELGREVISQFIDMTNCRPHFIVNLLDRRKFDANRDVDVAADGNDLVEQAWRGYHSLIDTAKLMVRETFGRGLFVDLHGHGHAIQRLELGYLLSKQELQKSDAELNQQDLMNKSSIRGLVMHNLQALTHNELIRGDKSLGMGFATANINAVPSPDEPFPLDDEDYFRGGYNTIRHGSRQGGSIDAIQIECHQDIRFDSISRIEFARDLAAVLIQYVQTHYNEGVLNHCMTSTVAGNLRYDDYVVLPNPASTTILIDAPRQITQIRIFDARGQVVINQAYRSQPITLESLSPGLYHVQMIGHRHLHIVKSLVIVQ